MLVLAVDDDPDDLEIFKEAVYNFDPSIDIITATNGQKAIDFLMKETVILPDYIFLDINMPELDGRECLKQMRTVNYLKKIPVCMYSTAALPSDNILFKELNATFLKKASGYSQVMSSISDTLKRLTNTL